MEGALRGQGGESRWSSVDQSPVPTRPPYTVLTAVLFVTAILAVLLTITKVIFGDAVPAVARGLLGSTGCGHSDAGKQKLRPMRDGRWRCCDCLWPEW